MTIWYVTANNLANSALGDGTVTAEWELEADNTHTPANDGTTKSISLLADQSGWAEIIYTFAGPAHTSATWGTITFSDLTMSLDIASFGTTGSLLGSVYRQDSGTISNRSLGSLQSISATTGVVTVTLFTNWNADSGSGNAATDIIAWDLKPNNNNMMTATTLTIYVTDSNTYLDVPLTPGSTTPTIVCPVISAPSTINNFTVRPVQKINFDVLTVPSSILNPTVFLTQTVTAQLLSAPSTIPNPSVVQNIELQVINSPSTLFNPTIKQDVILPVVVTASTINNPSVLHRFLISMQVLNASSTIFSPTVNQDIALNVYNSVTTIFSPSLNQDVVLPVLNAPDNVLQPATDTSVNIELLFVADDSTIFNPSLNQDVSLDTLNAPATVPNPTVTQAGAGQTINYEVINAASTVLNPSVTTLTTVVAQVLDSPSTVLSPSLKYDVVLPVVTTVSTIFSPSLEQIVQMQLVNTAPTVYAPRIGEEVDDGFSGAIIDRPGFPPFPIGIR